MAKNSGNSGFRIIVNTMTVGIEVAARFEDDVMDNLEEVCRAMVQDAKDNAPWNDLTGRARDELSSSIEENDGIYTVSLSHGVDYGQWLETIQSGRYQIIMPTIEAWGGEILRAVGFGTLREDN